MTDTPKFTPGPWEYDEIHDTSCGRSCTQDGCHDSHPSGIYNIDGPSLGDWPNDTLVVQNEADAALIAAAPELYEVLKKILTDELNRRKELKPGSPAYQFCNSRVKAAQVALAKAESAA